MIPENVIEEVTGRISKSVDKVLTDQREGRIETEPSLTDRLLANVERDFEDQEFPLNNQTIRLRARTLRDRGRNAPEHIYGADLTTVLSVDINDYKINKGILAQSKSINNASVNCSSAINSPYIDNVYFLTNPYNLSNSSIALEKTGTIEFEFPNSEFNRLKRQCELMLRVSPDSFVYLYCQDDIYVIPTSAVNAKSRTGTRVKFYCKNFKAFISDYLKSFIGDLDLQGTTDADFERLINRANSRNLLYLQLNDNNASR